jgi:hypothetical protein
MFPVLRVFCIVISGGSQERNTLYNKQSHVLRCDSMQTLQSFLPFYLIISSIAVIAVTIDGQSH